MLKYYKEKCEELMDRGRMKRFLWNIPVFLIIGATLACNLTSGSDQAENATQTPSLTASLDVHADLTERRSGANGAWAAAEGQSTVAIGDGIRTDAVGQATLVFFTGDVTQLAPNTELTVEHLGSGEGNQVSIDIVGGEIRNVVQRVMDSGDRFEVTTPAADAAVRGTIFTVRVDKATGETTISVEDGEVTVTPQVGAPVIVQPNFEVAVLPGQAPSAPRPRTTAPTPTSNGTALPTATIATSGATPTTAVQPLAQITIVTPRNDQVLDNGASLRVTGNVRGISGQLSVSIVDSQGNPLVTGTTPVNAGETFVPWSVDLRVSLPAGTSSNGRIVATAGTVSSGVRVQLGASSSIPPTSPPASTQAPISTATTAPTATTAISAFITISAPASQEAVSIRGFTVTGTAGAIFENSIVVEVRDASGNVIERQPVTFSTREVGGTGSWQASFAPANAQPGTTGSVYAYATSARDGSIIAEAQVAVTFQR
jgi:hypothetical protein